MTTVSGAVVDSGERRKRNSADDIDGIARVDLADLRDVAIDAQVSLVVPNDISKDFRIFGDAGLGNERHSATLRTLSCPEQHLSDPHNAANPIIFLEATDGRRFDEHGRPKPLPIDLAECACLSKLPERRRRQQMHWAWLIAVLDEGKSCLPAH